MLKDNVREDREDRNIRVCRHEDRWERVKIAEVSCNTGHVRNVITVHRAKISELIKLLKKYEEV